jgi:AbrB family looped-hinge helix DNA binding protein
METVGSNGQVVIPVEIRRELGLEPRQRIDVQLRDGVVVSQPVPRDLVKRLRGSLGGGSTLQGLIAEHAEEARRDGAPREARGQRA